MTIHRCRARRALLPLLLCAVLPLQAETDTVDGALPDRIFRHRIEGQPVSGEFVINGFPMPFPAGSHANGAQQASPAVYAGRFYFPASTLQSNINGLGFVTLNLQLQHRGTTYNPLVANNVAGVQLDGVYLQLFSATVSGIPVSLGSDCVFGPIVLGATGTWNGVVATMSGNGITIPPVPASACSGYGATLNGSIAGSNNAVTMAITL
ncbi:hypothetical protein [Tahibacter caeni]|uniref:hypothetical protein n=1 Tax=Tahibacter caeni TaxID=1453545 RepID=UPI0021479EFF|nr:hypothetical protein [Tahibacter caeni]